MSQSHKRCLAASDVDHYFAKNTLTDTQDTCFESHFLKQCPIYTILMLSQCGIFGLLHLSRSGTTAIPLLCFVLFFVFLMHKGNSKIAFGEH